MKISAEGPRVRLLWIGISALMALLLVTGVVQALEVKDYTTMSAQITDVIIYKTSGEISNATLGFDANWINGIAKTTGDPTTNPASNVTLGGAQSVLSHAVRISITTGGATGVATFKTSLNGGATWSNADYTTQNSAQNLMADVTDTGLEAIDTGLDVTFAGGASWTAGDVFTIASWWSESGTFPEKAAIIATGVASPTEAYTGSLEIIDLADDSLWMRFVATPENTEATDQNVLAGPVHALAARNGRLYLGSEDGNMSGFTVIDLAADTAWFYDYAGWGTSGWDWTGTLARRNDGDATDAGWITETAHYPNLSSYVVHDVDVSVVNDTTYVAIGTGDKINLLNLEANEIYTNSHDDCIGNISAVALVGNDLYWSGVRTIDPNQRRLCARYAITTITASGNWGDIDIYKDGWPHTAGLISDTITVLAGRMEASPEYTGSNILYVGTRAGLTIIHEDQSNYTSGDSDHYGYSHPYAIFTGTTDIVSDVDFAEGETAVYVATNDGEGHGGVSVLRPYMADGVTPFRIAGYVSPTLPSNNVVALAHGSDLIVGTAGDGASRLAEVPTSVGIDRFGVSAQPWSLLLIGLVLSSIAAASFGQVQSYRRRQDA